MLTTLRECLTNAGFDWETGRILYQPTSKDKHLWFEDNRYISQDHPILDTKFDDGECPAFIAEDACCIYFPVQYDGSTWVTAIEKNLDVYLSKETSYPGG